MKDIKFFLGIVYNYNRIYHWYGTFEYCWKIETEDCLCEWNYVGFIKDFRILDIGILM